MIPQLKQYKEGDKQLSRRDLNAVRQILKGLENLTVSPPLTMTKTRGGLALGIEPSTPGAAIQLAKITAHGGITDAKMSQSVWQANLLEDYDYSTTWPYSATVDEVASESIYVKNLNGVTPYINDNTYVWVTRVGNTVGDNPRYITWHMEPVVFPGIITETLRANASSSWVSGKVQLAGPYVGSDPVTLSVYTLTSEELPAGTRVMCSWEGDVIVAISAGACPTEYQA